MAGQGQWLSDPWGQAELRWWDGQQWTEHTHGVAGQTAGVAGGPQPKRSRGPLIAVGVVVGLVALIGLGVLVLAVAGGSSGSTFSEPGFQIKFEYPENFERTDVPEGNADESVSVLIDNKNGIGVSKFEQDNPSDPRLAKPLLDGVVKQLSVGTPSPAERVTVGGKLGYAYEFSPRGLPGTRSRSIFFYNGSDQYQLNCQFQPAKRAEVLEACDQAVRTLEVTGPGL